MRCATLSLSLVLILAVLTGAPAYSAPSGKTAIYDESGKGHELFAKALEQAKKENKRVLVQYGGNWCGWCILLHKAFNENAELKALLDKDYVTVNIDTRSNKDLVKAYAPEVSGVPYLSVFDADGNLLTSHETGSFEKGQGHDPEKLKAWLSEQAATKPSADELAQKALERAKDQNKRVFLAFGSPSCGWCRRLDDFLRTDPAAAVIEKDYVLLKVDVEDTPGAKEFLGKYVPGGQTGIPWYAILDAEGKTLITSEAPGSGNVGYPAAPAEMAHFMTMVEKTAQHMKPEEQASLKTFLKARAEKLKGR